MHTAHISNKIRELPPQHRSCGFTSRRHCWRRLVLQRLRLQQPSRQPSNTKTTQRNLCYHDRPSSTVQRRPACIPPHEQNSGLLRREIHLLRIIIDAVTSVDVATTCKIQITGQRYTGTSEVGATVVQELVCNPALLSVPNTFNCTSLAATFWKVIKLDVALISTALPNPFAQVVPLFVNNAYTANFTS